MAKLILSLDGQTVREYLIDKERITIGRRPNNDIQIDNLAVSGEHAVITTILNDSFLEDMDSTNGTLVNGEPVKKHYLQNNDVIEIGKYRLTYFTGQAVAAPEEEPQDFERTMIIRSSPLAAKPAPAPMEEPVVPTSHTSTQPVSRYEGAMAAVQGLVRGLGGQLAARRLHDPLRSGAPNIAAWDIRPRLGIQNSRAESS